MYLGKAQTRFNNTEINQIQNMYLFSIRSLRSEIWSLTVVGTERDDFQDSMMHFASYVIIFESSHSFLAIRMQ